ncbi:MULTISPECIES: serine/threonine protein kinase [Pirellulaceae]|uniref:serine/threonine protein kinase n=1 Tax=Pirellulaceae TaxID=2691357 RepID=UPI001304A513|nr:MULTISPECIES: serine/threonine-protein kinase [Pirellulaceae]
MDGGQQLKQAKVMGDRASQVLKVGKVAANCFVASEFVEGQFLDEVLNHRLFSTEEAVTLVRSLLPILQFGHQQGLIHRGISPESIILTVQKRLLLMEYGVDSRWKIGSGNRSLHAYHAPEQVKEDESGIGPATDVYCIGVLLYELLTGTVPFKCAHDEVLDELIVTRNPTPVRLLAPEVPPGLERIVNRCLAKDPHQRFSSLADLRKSLEEYAAEKSQQSTVVSNQEKPKKRSLRIVISSVLLLAVMPIAYFVIKDRGMGPINFDSMSEETEEESSGFKAFAKQESARVTEDELDVEPELPAVGEMREGGIDLMARIELPKHVLSEPWRWAGKSLVCEPRTDQNSILRIPYDAPAEYTIEFKVRSLGADNGGALLLGLANDRVGFGAHLKGYAAQSWLLEYGSEPASPENGMHQRRMPAKFFQSEQPVVIRCTVDADSVRVEENGRLKLEWKGDFDKLSRERCWATENVPNQRVMFICTWGAFEFSEIRVHPATGKS